MKLFCGPNYYTPSSNDTTIGHAFSTSRRHPAGRPARVGAHREAEPETERPIELGVGGDIDLLGVQFDGFPEMPKKEIRVQRLFRM